jgi:DNA-binding transcriptional LysR family regulator
MRKFLSLPAPAPEADGRRAGTVPTSAAMSFRFDLVDLRLFAHVVEGGSITAGAAAAGLALAAASARLLAMEDTLGAPLLLRLNRGVQPTASGQALLLHARQVQQRLELLNAELGPHSRTLRARVRLWCNTVAMHEYIPDLLGDYLLAHPQVNIELQERAGNEVVHALAEGHADIGIVRDHTDTFELETHAFQPDRLVLVAPPGHPLALAAGQGPVKLEQADACDIVGLQRGIALQDIWDSRVAQRGRRLNYRVRVGSFDAQCRLVARGAGVAVMPLTSAQRHARRLDIRIVPLAEPFTAYALKLCVRRLDEQPQHVRRLVDELLRAPVQRAG